MRLDRRRAAWLVLSCAVGFGALVPGAEAQPRLDGAPLACLTAPEARQLFVANRLVPPFRVMREAAFTARAEAIDIQLCRFQGGLAYDVTLLNEAGEILHRMINAATGAPIAGYPLAGQRPLARPGEMEPRPGRLPPPVEYEGPNRLRPLMGPGMGPGMGAAPGAPAGGPPGAPGASGPPGRE